MRARADPDALEDAVHGWWWRLDGDAAIAAPARPSGRASATTAASPSSWGRLGVMRSTTCSR